MNTETTRTVSAAKLAANRRNAQRSTGPVSAYGRAMSSGNAVKHGVLARTVLALGRQARESICEFKKLCAAYYASLAPVGPLEEMLVDEIVQATWRLRRARKAESGEIALGVDKGCCRRRNENPVLRLFAEHKSPFAGMLRPQLERSVEGCSYLSFKLRNLLLSVREKGELTGEALADFEEGLGNDPDVFVERLRLFVSEGPSLTGNPSGEAPETAQCGRQGAESETAREDVRPTSEIEKERAANTATVLELIRGEMHRLIVQEEKCERGAKVEERAHRAVSGMPGTSAMDKILKYEKGLERQLYKAMDRLVRMQSIRLKVEG